MSQLPQVLALFVLRMACGYALCLGLIGPGVRQGSWRRVSLFVIAALAVVAAVAGAPRAPTLSFALGALLLERALTFEFRLATPVWIVPLALWALLAAEWPPGLDTFPSAIAIGGTLGAMLLGHSYLTARGLSFEPLRRMALLVFVILAMRALSVVPAFLVPQLPMMDMVFLSMRVGLGLLLPLVLGWMVLQCVKIESNQSATGILYAMTVLVGVFGELVAVYLRVHGNIPA